MGEKVVPPNDRISCTCDALNPLTTSFHIMKTRKDKLSCRSKTSHLGSSFPSLVKSVDHYPSISSSGLNPIKGLIPPPVLILGQN
ncbi:hypothetical protein KY285_031091 [Solanum tuberosum]|nr:hypothetical protein KY285_031091 [Solanum tuberosum]